MEGALKADFRLSNGVHHTGVGVVVPGQEHKAELMKKALPILKTRELKLKSRRVGGEQPEDQEKTIKQPPRTKGWSQNIAASFAGL